MAPPKAPNENSGQFVSPLECVVALRSVGFSIQDSMIMAAIWGAESNYDRTAVGRAVPERPDYGVGQINYIHKDILPDGYFPPGNGWTSVTNCAIATKKIWDMQGWGAWVQYKNGSYQKYLGKVQQDAARDPNKVTNPGFTSSWQPGANLNNTGVSIDINGAGLAGELASVGANAGVAAVQWWQDPAGIQKAMWIGGGSLLIMLGILLLAKNLTPLGAITKVVGKVTK